MHLYYMTRYRYCSLIRLVGCLAVLGLSQQLSFCNQYCWLWNRLGHWSLWLNLRDIGTKNLWYFLIRCVSLAVEILCLQFVVWCKTRLYHCLWWYSRCVNYIILCCVLLPCLVLRPDVNPWAWRKSTCLVLFLSCPSSWGDCGLDGTRLVLSCFCLVLRLEVTVGLTGLD